MGNRKTIRKVEKELSYLIAQSESITENLKAAQRLCEKQKKPKTFNLCGVRIVLGHYDNGSYEVDNSGDEFDDITG